MSGSGSPYATASDEEVVAAHVAGDAGAFDELVARYSRRVYGMCFRYFGNAADAEDAAQEVFLTLLRRVGSFRGAARFSTWLFRVTMNTCNDLARRRARRPVVSGEVQERGAVDDALAARELRADLAQALAALDADQREAVLLHDVLGLPYEDIAERTGVALGTVKSRIHRGHARLARILRAADGKEAATPPTDGTARGGAAASHPGAAASHPGATPAGEPRPREPQRHSEPPTS